MRTYTRTTQKSRRTRGRDGFSLLELLAVMAIVAMLSTLAVTSYFSAIRGMSSRTARRGLTNALSMARQRACIDGCRVSLIIFNEAAGFDTSGSKVSDLAASYVVCRELGRFSFVREDLLFDEYADLNKLFREKLSTDTSSDSVAGAIRLYNLSAGSWSLVRPYVVKENVGSKADLLYSGNSFQIEAYAFQRLTGSGMQSSGGGNPTWKAGDSYGIEVMPVQSLPKGFSFRELNANASSDASLTDVRHVTFEPDGSALAAATFTVESQDPNAKGAKFTINKRGEIQVSN
ncbi:MAG: type II secretion system protein [Kiritimatiellia bacterium]|jgi:prepilin-type N-terminal cleavage/methylation domain-containing protein|nr:type II secretion system protein [Kiritimatiellia bacterium]